jgi:hypothetical protein
MKQTKTVFNESGKSRIIEAEIDESDNDMEGLKQMWQRILSNTKGKAKTECMQVIREQATTTTSKRRKEHRWMEEKKERNELVTNHSRMTRNEHRQYGWNHDEHFELRKISQ